MELILINQNKLKIMLTPPDMQHYALHDTPLCVTDTSTRRAFRHIFHDAKSMIGFDTHGQKLFVQLFGSKDGGCEIFVTKMGQDEPPLADEMPKIDAYQAIQSVLVSAESLSDLISLCQRLRSVGYPSESSAYIEEIPSGRKYHLLLRIPIDEVYFLPEAYAFLSEYGDTCEGEMFEIYLGEHGHLLCEGDAVERLGG